MLRAIASLALLSLVAGCKGGTLLDDKSASSEGGTSSVGGRGSAGGARSTGGASLTGGASVAPASGGAAGAGGQDAAVSGGASPGRGGSQGGGTGSGGLLGGAAGTTVAGGAGGATAKSDGGPSGGNTGAGGSADAGRDVGSAGGAGGGARTCAGLPAVTDYAAAGPFGDAKMFPNVGPNGNYTLFRPDASLGQNGFLHPVAAWGNGISTTPDMYQKTLNLIASHGFVIIACNDTQVEEPCVSSGLDWLIQQNTATGAMKGKLDTTNEVIIGYSWGGGAAIDTSVRPNVKATVSLHGMPPRQSPWAKDHAPLLLFTSTGDNFVTASGYVTPNYQASTVQTFYATLNDSTAGHLYVVDELSLICVGSLLGPTFGNCGNATLERAPTIAWLRMWACADSNAKRFFYGDNCTLCQSPWTNPQRKNWQ